MRISAAATRARHKFAAIKLENGRGNPSYLRDTGYSPIWSGVIFMNAEVNQQEGAAPEDAPAAASAEPTPEERIADLEGQLAQAREDFLRAKAETENTRRRAQTDISNAHKYATENFAESLLAVKDSLEAALNDQSASLDTLKNGVELTLRQLKAAFEKGRVAELNPVGEKFDPNKHQSISTIEVEGEPNRVIAVLQKGYQLSERVLRPALVTVSKAKPAADA
jgi:molecular chaperone GrpE